MSHGSVDTVLIVDDPQASDLFQDTLVGAGYRVEKAPTGAAALERLTHNGLSLLLINLRLPDMDGVGLADRADAKRRLPALIFSEDRPSVDTLRRLQEHGLGYAEGPDNPGSKERFLGQIRETLVRHRLRIQIEGLATEVSGLARSTESLCLKLDGFGSKILSKEEIVESLSSTIQAAATAAVLREQKDIESIAKAAVSDSWWVKSIVGGLIGVAGGLLLLQIEVALVMQTVGLKPPAASIQAEHRP